VLTLSALGLRLFPLEVLPVSPDRGAGPTDASGAAGTPSGRVFEIVVVGSINRDYVLEVPVRPGPGETVGGATLVVSDGGKGANQAVAAAEAGTSVALIARVGDDPESEGLVRRMAACGVDTSWILRSKDAATGVAFVTVTPDGENQIIVAPGANALLSGSDLRLRPVSSAIEVAKALVLQLEIDLDAVQAAIAIAGPETCVILNGAPARVLAGNILERVDVLVVNEHEALTLLGADPDTAIMTAIFELAVRGPDVVVVTRGARGALVLVMSAQEVWGELAPQVPVVDTTGAGDVFVGVLAASLAHSERRPGPELVRHAVRRATQAASLAVSHKGARLRQ
jgi:ribokinase